MVAGEGGQTGWVGAGQLPCWLLHGGARRASEAARNPASGIGTNTCCAGLPASSSVHPTAARGLLRSTREAPPAFAGPALQALLVETLYGTLVANCRPTTHLYRIPHDSLLSIGIDFQL